jgi:uncharacterized protein (TIGR02145 family)
MVCCFAKAVCSTDLSGTVTDLSGTPLFGAGVTLALAGHSTGSSANGTWSISLSATSIEGGRTTSAVPRTRHLVLDGNHLRLRFDDVDAAGRQSNAAVGAIHESPLRTVNNGVAARSASVAVDTLLYSWNGRVRARVGVASLAAGNLGAQAIDTASTSVDIPWNSAISYGTLTDSRDGQVYRTVVIGTQTWLAQNLNYSGSGSAAVGTTLKSKIDTGIKYGRLYTWSEAMGIDISYDNALWGQSNGNHQGICPSGWHVPSDAEWTVLTKFVDSTQTVEGAKLKSANGWFADNGVSGNGADPYGFRALAGSGSYAPTSSGYLGYWWTATERYSDFAWFWELFNSAAVIYRQNDFGKTYANSLRCALGAQTAAAHDTSLKSLVVDNGTLRPAFDPKVTSYRDTVSSDTLRLVAMAADSTDTVSYVGTNIGSNLLVMGISEPAQVVVHVKNINGNSWAACTVSVYHKVVDPADKRMKFIPSGTFTMGDPSSTTTVEAPHTVRLSAFWMDSTDVTQGQYSALMGVNPTAFASCGSTCPQDNVTWFQAVRYCNARSKLAGLDTVYSYSDTTVTYYGNGDVNLGNFGSNLGKNGYRLPTEAQWEYAARGGTTTTYYWGNDTTNASLYAWYEGNSDSAPHPVATKLPNSYGLYDMAGNVFQWVGDWWNSSYLSTEDDPTGPTSGVYKVVRGCGWGWSASQLSTFNRSYSVVTSKNMGFRCVRPAWASTSK